MKAFGKKLKQFYFEEVIFLRTYIHKTTQNCRTLNSLFLLFTSLLSPSDLIQVMIMMSKDIFFTAFIYILILLYFLYK